MIDHVLVHIDADAGDCRVGEVRFVLRRGALAGSTLLYDPAWLANPRGFAIEPGLPLVAGPQFRNGLPGALQDASPDRWGRNLITKARRASRPSESGAAPALTDIDYLLGVSDLTRQGAIRLRLPDEAEFLAPGGDVPKLLELPRLLRAAEAATRDGAYAEIKALLDAGSGSLGGARPKASVRDGGRLLMAKFPHRDDEWDVMGWEKVALDLAAAAGIRVPPNRLIRIDGQSVLLVERFDRRQGRRVPYISAMTLLEAGDRAPHDYLDIAEALPEVAAEATEDLRELWCRMAFSVLINNTDDHLRNHGFLHEPGGWRLSPVFDVNPNPDPRAPRQTSIAGEVERRGASAALLDVASEFRLGKHEADELLEALTTTVSAWREVAARNGISGEEVQQFAGAFEPRV